jgi:hypothetical protein
VADKVPTSKALIDLAHSPVINRKKALGEVAASLDADQLLTMYEELVGSAPQRHSREKKHFVGHTGVPSTTGVSTRTEDHLAIALCDLDDTAQLSTTERLTLLDYQVPMKARQTDAGVGKVDIVAATASGRIAVVELKVTTNTSTGDTPLRALIESLVYYAIVEANASDMSAEIADTYGIHTAADRSHLVVVGPPSYWLTWPTEALTAISTLLDRSANALDMNLWFVDLGGINVEMGRDGTRPQILGTLTPLSLHTARPDGVET